MKYRNLKSYPGGQRCGNFEFWEKNEKGNKLQRSNVTSLLVGSCNFYYIYPEKTSRPQTASSAQHRQHQPQQGPVVPCQTAPTSSCLVVDKQDWLALLLTLRFVDTSRWATVESTEARNGSWSVARTRGVGLFRRAAGAAVCSLRPRACHVVLEKMFCRTRSVCYLDMTEHDPS